MKYYKDKATPERMAWWKKLPKKEQYLRTQLFRLEKYDKSEQKKLASRKDESMKFAKQNIRGLKIVIKAIKRQLLVKGDWRRDGPYSVAWYCGHCQQPIPIYANYCLYCGQKVAD